MFLELDARVEHDAGLAIELAVGVDMVFVGEGEGVDREADGEGAEGFAVLEEVEGGGVFAGGGVARDVEVDPDGLIAVAGGVDGEGCADIGARGVVGVAQGGRGRRGRLGGARGACRTGWGPSYSWRRRW